MADTENIGYESSIESETSSVAETKEGKFFKEIQLRILQKIFRWNSIM